MSSAESLRKFVLERLTTAAEEIVSVFEKTIIDYEKEIQRQRKLLAIVCEPQVKLLRTEVQDHLSKATKVESEVQLSPQENSSLKEPSAELDQIKQELGDPCAYPVSDPLQPKQEVDPVSLTLGSVGGENNVEQHVSCDPNRSQHTADEESVNIVIIQSVGVSDITSNLVSPSETTDVSQSLHPIVSCNEYAEPKAIREKGEQRKHLENAGKHPAVPTPTHLYTKGGNEVKLNYNLFGRKVEPLQHQQIHANKKQHVCNVCGKHFNQASWLKQHLRVHTGERPFSCDTCGKRYTRKSTLQSHQKTHSLERPFACTVCKRRFFKEWSLEAHAQRHKASYDWTTQQSSSLGSNVEVKDEQEETFIGHGADQQTAELPPSPSHDDEATNPHQAQPGSSSSDNTRDRQSRLRKSLHSIYTSRKIKFKCELCGKDFAFKSWLLEHMRTHTGAKPFSCSVCGKCFVRRSVLKDHMRTHTGERPYLCSTCGKTFRLRSILIGHQKTHSLPNPIPRGVTIFPVGPTGTDLPDSTADGQAGQQQPLFDVRPNNSHEFKCGPCGKVYRFRSQLMDHISVHTGVKLHICTVCGRSFRQKCVLKVHQQTHAIVTAFCCTVCGKGFAEESLLTAHYRAHASAKPYGCSVCGKHFLRRSWLKTHLRIHTGERPYPCNTCGKSFSQRSGLIVHMKTHSLERPFACSVCKKRFFKERSLEVHAFRHMREQEQESVPALSPDSSDLRQKEVQVHVNQQRPNLDSIEEPSRQKEELISHHEDSPEPNQQADELLRSPSCDNGVTAPHQSQPSTNLSGNTTDGQARPLKTPYAIYTSRKGEFKCELCGKEFIFRSRLMEHMRMHMGVKPYGCNICGKRFARGSMLKDHARTHTGERPYSCNTCGKSFRQRSTLIGHQKTHSSERPYACAICKKRFVKEKSLEVHVQQHLS